MKKANLFYCSCLSLAIVFSSCSTDTSSTDASLDANIVVDSSLVVDETTADSEIES